MLAAHAVVTVVARSLAQVEDQLTPPQRRLLLVIAGRGEMPLNAAADAMGVHPSNATRTADGLVVARLLARGESPADRRLVVLSLSPGGRALIDSVVEYRRRAIEEILTRMPDRRRRTLAAALESFAAAAGEPAGDGEAPWGWSG